MNKRRPPRPPQRPRTGRRLLLVAAVLALLGTGVLDAAMRVGTAPPGAAAAVPGTGPSLARQSSSSAGAQGQLPLGLPGAGRALPPGSAPLQSVDGPSAVAAVQPSRLLLAIAPLSAPAASPAPGSAAGWDGRAPPQAAGTFAPLPPRP